MPFGILTPEMEQAIASFVRGEHVWDLGSGDLAYAKTLLRLGTRHITAVDKEQSFRKTPPQVTFLRLYFADLLSQEPDIQTAFLSWPQNCASATPGLPRLVQRAQTVIYLGCNLGGSQCGTEPLWADLIQRDVLAHIPNRRNNLIVYGKHTGFRRLLPEEIGAISEPMLSYEDAIALASDYSSSSSS